MPTPTDGESQKDFISRCIPMVLDEGTAKDNEQAFAVCTSMWEQHMNASKSGARHNKGDQAKIDKWHKAADELKQDMADLGATLESFDNSLKAISETPDELRVANYIALFGGRDLEGIGSGRKNGDGSIGEFFTKATDFESDVTKSGKLPIDWEHNTMKRREIDGMKPGDYLGYVDWKTAKTDERGVWVERVLNRRNKYMQWLETLIKQGLIGNSSEADSAKVSKRKTGEIEKWPLVRDTFTVQPMEPRMMTQNVITALKALGFDSTDTDHEQQPQAIGAGSASSPTGAATATATADSSAGSLTDKSNSQEITNMDEKELAKLVADNIAAALKAKDEAAVAEAKAKADREAEIAKAVEAARKEERENAAKARRLSGGDGQAPYQTKFGATRKYDALKAEDAALVASMLMSAPRGGNIPTGLAQAIMIKVAEDKGNAEVKAVRHDAAKAIGFDPQDALDAAKANELDYSTQSGFGDEFVPTVWSTSIWEQIRFGEDLVNKIPQQMFDGPGDVFTIPLEAADMTWYRVGQATDLNATTGLPDATIGDSKVATANINMTFGAGQKMATRVPYAGELVEDSIVPWASQVNSQLQKSFLEMIQHVVIDGDTATGATTNINHIGGTPTSTGTKQDLFLLLNGFRKSPLVTTTANSLSAAGGLTDTNFLQIAQLLGPAGLYADSGKCAFVLDANVYWKILQLASVKTRDVFLNATLENGRIDNIWGFPVYKAPFMHFRSTTNPRKANTAGKVDLTTQANNTTGSALCVRWDQWLLGYKRNLTLSNQFIPGSDAYQIIATARLNMIQRDTEGSSILYNIGV